MENLILKYLCFNYYNEQLSKYFIQQQLPHYIFAVFDSTITGEDLHAATYRDIDYTYQSSSGNLVTGTLEDAITSDDAIINYIRASIQISETETFDTCIDIPLGSYCTEAPDSSDLYLQGVSTYSSNRIYPASENSAGAVDFELIPLKNKVFYARLCATFYYSYTTYIYKSTGYTEPVQTPSERITDSKNIVSNNTIEFNALNPVSIYQNDVMKDCLLYVPLESKWVNAIIDID